MLRAYIRPEPRFSLPKQAETIRDLGEKVTTYTEEFGRANGRLPERDLWIASLRIGTVAVVSDFHRIATSAVGLKEARAAIKAQGAVVLEARTGRRSDDPDALGDMIQEALRFYSQRGLTTEEARRLGRMGAASSPATKAKKGRMPIAEALPIWRDNAIPSIEAALEKINADKRYKTPYTQATAYRYLRAREVRAGRPAGVQRPVRGYVYFLQDGKDGPVKIGYSRDPEKRAASMITGHHGEKYTLLFYVRGTITTEQKFHKRFTGQKKVREWFHYDGALKRFILEQKKERDAWRKARPLPIKRKN